MIEKTLLGLKSSWYFPHCKDLLQGPKLWGWYCAHVLVFRKASSNMSVCLYLVIWNLFHQRVRKVPIIFTSRLPTSDGPKSYTRPYTALRNSSDTLSESPCNAKHNQTPTHNSLRPSTWNWNVTPPKPPLGVSEDVWGQLLVPIGHICCPELSGNIWKGSLSACRYMLVGLRCVGGVLVLAVGCRKCSTSELLRKDSVCLTHFNITSPSSPADA